MSKNKTFKIREFLKNRPLSWSAISSFEWDKEQWYRNYYLGQKDPMTPELIFGAKFALSCEKKKPLAPVTMLSEMEHAFKVVFNGIPLTGFADTYCRTSKRKIGEYKTGVKAWDQKRVDQHGQITMYALMNYISHRIKPEDTKFFLEWIPTRKIMQENGDYSKFDYTIGFESDPPEVRTFHTKRTMKDILTFGNRINNTIEEMERYVQQHD